MNKNYWSVKCIEDIYEELKTQKTGLTNKEVNKRLKIYGKNSIHNFNWYLIESIKKYLKFIVNPISLLFLVAAIVTYLLGAHFDSYVILAVLIINVIVSYLQENKSSKALNKLLTMEKHYTQVLRDGKLIVVDSIKLVPGDIVFLRVGMQVPADIRVIEANDLHTNESILTGEWKPAEKIPVCFTREQTTTNSSNTLWKGTNVVKGNCKGIVVSTGIRTEVGKIANSLKGRSGQTPLQKDIKNIAAFLTILVFISVSSVFVFGYFFSEIPFVELVKTSIAIAIAGIPEGLPATITFILALGINRIAKKNGLVKNLLAAETLGTTSWILTDKTGTLTEGDMVLKSIKSIDHKCYITDKITKKCKEYLTYSYLTTDYLVLKSDENTEVKFGYPIEIAVSKALSEVENLEDVHKDFERKLYIPFNSNDRFSACILYDKKKSEHKYFSLGSPEVIIEKCKYVRVGEKYELMTKENKEKIYNILKQEMGKGRRVIGLLSADCKEKDEYLDDSSVNLNEARFENFLSFEDPIRKDAKESIAHILKEDVQIRVMTGDQPETAIEIAKQAGILLDSDPNEYLIGDDVDNMEDGEIYEKLQKTKIFAKMKPAHKLRVLKILLTRNEIVAMTGDGVNDAPALYAASIGIAINSGTDVAKEASDLVLVKNSFSTIVEAIHEGKRIISNLKKVTIYLLSTSFSEMVLVSSALLMTGLLPITSVQILWANLIEESLIGFAFAFENERTFMKKLKKGDRIIDSKIKIVIVTFIIMISSFLAFIYYLLQYSILSVEQIQTVMFILISFDSMFIALSLKEINTPITKINFLKGWILPAVIVSTLLLFLGLYWGPLSNLLGVVEIPAVVYLIVVIMGIMHFTFIEYFKMKFIK